MGNDTSKTKSAMLSELESIKGLLLEDDDIPILQEVIEPPARARPPESEAKHTARLLVEEQQDFFHSGDTPADADEELPDTSEDLLDSLDDLEEKTAQFGTGKPQENYRPTANRVSMPKATGENPFLPEHIRARLHGNNPPPLFATETAKKIAGSARPVTQLGSLQERSKIGRAIGTQQDIIDSIIARMMPEIEKELRQRLEAMSKNMLDEMNK